MNRKLAFLTLVLFLPVVFFLKRERHLHAMLDSGGTREIQVARSRKVAEGFRGSKAVSTSAGYCLRLSSAQAELVCAISWRISFR